MTIADAAVGAMCGRYDVFDRVSGWLTALQSKLQAADGSEMVDVHLASDENVSGFFGSKTDPIHVVDTRAELLERVAAAIQQISDICTLTQEIEAALPD